MHRITHRVINLLWKEKKLLACWKTRSKVLFEVCEDKGFFPVCSTGAECVNVPGEVNDNESTIVNTNSQLEQFS